MTSRFVVALLVALGIGVPCVRGDSELERRYLAVDESLHAKVDGLELVMGQAGDATLVLRGPEAAWERHNNIGISTGIGRVLEVPYEDASGRYKYRLYYHVMQPAQWSIGQWRGTDHLLRLATAMAVSNDGVNWIKPALNVAPHLLAEDTPDAHQNNIISVEPHPAMRASPWSGTLIPLYDPHAPSDERFKAFWKGRDGLYIATSADGLHFAHSRFVFRHKSDTNHSFFYDHHHGQYVAYGRKRGHRDWGVERGHPYEHRRGIALHRSPRWDDEPWQTVGLIAVDPLDVWDWGQYEPGDHRIRPDINAPVVMRYHGQYIGMPEMYFQDESRVPHTRPDYFLGTGPTYPIFMYSHDGERWHFPHSDHSIIDLEPHKRLSRHPKASRPELMEVGAIRMGNLLEIDDRLLIYYVDGTANEAEIHEDDTYTLYVQFMRVDGFASLRAKPDRTGEWLTPALHVLAGATALRVNAAVKGSLHVEVIDAATHQPITGLSRAEAVAFTGDDVRHVVRWTDGELGDVAGRSVQLRFVIEDGAIYSFSFSAAKESSQRE